MPFTISQSEFDMSTFTGRFRSFLKVSNPRHAFYSDKRIEVFKTLIKKFENLPNGAGIMADDIIAGLFALFTQAAILTSINQNIYIKTLWN